ncbi:MAG TPA: hypothetical protein DIW23_03440 [Anaerolineae bacterium]|nr:hypothetical protein [Anaerolineae bacterium]
MKDNPVVDKNSKSNVPIKLTVHWQFQALYIIGIVGSIYVTIISWLSSDGIALPLCFGIFGLTFFYVYLLSRSNIQVDEQSLVITSTHGIYKIDWHEIKIIETNNVAFAFLGEDKCLSMNLTMVGNRKQEFYEFLNKKIAEKNIQIKPLSSMKLFQKNTKIRGFGLRF